MPSPKLTKLDLEIMETLWTRGSASIREIQEGFPESDRPAYTTIQTTVYRLESKQAVRRVKKVELSHLRGGGLPQRRPEQTRGRIARVIWRTHAARHGASD